MCWDSQLTGKIAFVQIDDNTSDRVFYTEGLIKAAVTKLPVPL